MNFSNFFKIFHWESTGILGICQRRNIPYYYLSLFNILLTNFPFLIHHHLLSHTYILLTYCCHSNSTDNTWLLCCQQPELQYFICRVSQTVPISPFSMLVSLNFLNFYFMLFQVKINAGSKDTEPDMKKVSCASRAGCFCGTNNASKFQKLLSMKLFVGISAKL